MCTTRAAAVALEMELTATDAESLGRFEDVVARHVVRFAWREPPGVT